MDQLEKRLGYSFQNRALLENAITHSSYANENRSKGLQSNERLEFLGDSVLGMVTADYLFRTHPELPEGDLTRTRAVLVCEGSLVEMARTLDLGMSAPGQGGGCRGWPGAALHRGRRGRGRHRRHLSGRRAGLCTEDD